MRQTSWIASISPNAITERQRPSAAPLFTATNQANHRRLGKRLAIGRTLALPANRPVGYKGLATGALRPSIFASFSLMEGLLAQNSGVGLLKLLRGDKHPLARV